MLPAAGVRPGHRHPSLSPALAIPLTLRAVGGLATREIAAALPVPEPTMGQRISRARARIKASGRPATPGPRSRFRAAAARTANLREREYLTTRAARLASAADRIWPAWRAGVETER
jgi:Sigma-70, region 4